MRSRVPQPPINPASRDKERHGFWLGFAVVAVGALLILCGARHITGIDTVDGNSAWETQLVKAFSSGGLQYPQQQNTAPPPPSTDDPAAMVDALNRWASRQANPPAPTWRVRIDTASKAACPT
jgi:hypothetical protein